MCEKVQQALTNERVSKQPQTIKVTNFITNQKCKVKQRREHHTLIRKAKIRDFEC